MIQTKWYKLYHLLKSLFLDPASSQEIINICSSLRPEIAAGYDDIPICIVKGEN